MTQSEADRLIDFYINEAVNCEEIRDNCERESATFWQWHDQAMHWHWRAEQLMPKSGRTISVEDWS